jgi:hypothetical protein
LFLSLPLVKILQCPPSWDAAKKENPPRVHCRSSAAFRTIFRITGCFGTIVKAISGYQNARTSSLKRAALRILRIKIFQITQLNNLNPSALIHKVLIRF